MKKRASFHFDFLDLQQPQKGYRYNVDSFLLARFAQFKNTDRVCDLGTGVGLIGLVLLTRKKVKEVVGVEIQQELAKYAQINIQKLSFSESMKLIECNWKNISSYLKKHSFDAVISNPPYRKINTGKIPPHSVKAIAKHEILGSMKDLLLAAIYLLKNKGRLYLVYPTLRLEELILTLHQSKFKISRMAFIYPFIDSEATQVLVEAVRSAPREIKIEKPIVLYESQNSYKKEIEEFIGVKQKNYETSYYTCSFRG